MWSPASRGRCWYRPGGTAATALAALVVAQIAIGAIGTATGLTPLVRGLHLASAAAVWGVAVLLAALVARGAPAAAPLASGESAAASTAEIVRGAPVRGY